MDGVVLPSTTTTPPNSQTSGSIVLNLPYELRQRILRYATHRHEGWFDIQSTKVSQDMKFRSGSLCAIFAVSRSLRDEALEAFYSINSFLWTIEVDNETRSDPCDYPKHSSEAQADREAWRNVLPTLLSTLCEKMDGGRRLRTLWIKITTKRIQRRPIWFNADQQAALQVLWDFQVRGKAKVFSASAYRAAIKPLDLEHKMKA
ncbi:uncharacterized protein LTR77_006155 [Saxophila tyrrhenica]|uniref:Uncharacterized protein n=1 Tax=Saxophila tyrrhenica TaxID=1690608 RepID=A0AAV9P983_9PEZI|nr:hypothetical protein LTR77_006155 [Saxophila tyrrhenica]